MYRPHDETRRLLRKMSSLQSKTVFITGATDGIGLAFARVIAWAGWNIVLCARSARKASRVISELQSINPDIKIHSVVCELSSLDSINKAIRSIRKIDLQLHLVFLNAGITSSREEKTDKGISSVFFVNHIAQQALLMGIQHQLADQSRIVIQSSVAHKFAREPRLYTEYMNIQEKVASSVYADSKCANICLAYTAGKYLTQKQGRQIMSYAVHPGYLVTNINRDMFMQPLYQSLLDSLCGRVTPLMLRLGYHLGVVQPSVEHAAHPAIVAALAENPSFFTGPSGYFELYGPPMPAKIYHDISTECAQILWEQTEQCIAELHGST